MSEQARREVGQGPTNESDCKQSPSVASTSPRAERWPKPNWEEIKADYLTGELTVKELAEKYGVSTNQIYKKVSSEGWKKTLEKIRQKTEEKYVARVARTRAREIDVIAGATERMASLLAKTVDELDAQPTDKRLRNLKGLAATASAIETNLQTTMKLLGIQTRAQEEAQKIARARLELDRRKQRYVENKDKNANAPRKILFEVELMPGEEAEGEIDG